jgi:hypothetical protein
MYRLVTRSRTMAIKATEAAPDLVNEEPIDTDQAARMMGVASQTLRNKRVSGDGPPYLKYSRRVLYLPSDVRAYMAARRVTSTSQARP